MSGKEKLNEYITSAKGRINELFVALQESRVTRRGLAGSLWYYEEKFAVYSLTLGELSNVKHHFYNCGRIDEYLINKFDDRILDSGISHLSYALLSDDLSLIRRYAELSHSCYKPMVEMGHSTPLYVMQRIMANDWDNVKRGIKIMDEKTLKRNKPLKPDRDFYEAVLNKDADSAKAAITQLLKDHKKRNKYLGLASEFISMPALGYTKLAWLKGMELDIDHPLVPKELLPFKPLDKYDVAYDFLKE
ncbi:MAG: immunity 49 family protein [Bacteroidota bacterium]